MNDGFSSIEAIPSPIFATLYVILFGTIQAYFASADKAFKI